MVYSSRNVPVFTCIIVGILTFISSCINGSPEKTVNIKEVTDVGFVMDSMFASKPGNIDKPVKAYVIVPNSGCEGCISSTEQMLQTFIASKYPVKFILTNIVSLKVLKLKLGDSIINNRNVYIDTGNVIYQRFSDIKQIYPAVYYPNMEVPKERLVYIAPGEDDVMKTLVQRVTSGKTF